MNNAKMRHSFGPNWRIYRLYEEDRKSHGVLIKRERPHFGNIFVSCRETKGLNQKAIAHILGVSISSVSAVEVGKTAPFKPKDLKKICDITGMDYLLLAQAAVDDETLKWERIYGLN